jgi:hypothetical protein
MNTYTLKYLPSLLPYNGLFSNTILISIYFDTFFNQKQAYLFSEDARLITYEATCIEKVIEKRTV